MKVSGIIVILWLFLLAACSDASDQTISRISDTQLPQKPLSEPPPEFPLQHYKAAIDKTEAAKQMLEDVSQKRLPQETE